MRQKWKVEIIVDANWNKEDIEIHLKKEMKVLDLGVSNVKKIPNRRSMSQNNTLHGWLDILGNNAGEGGLTISVLYKEPTELLITPEILKGYAQQVAQASFGTKHTSKLDTKQFSALVDFLENRFATALDNKISFNYKQYENDIQNKRS